MQAVTRRIDYLRLIRGGTAYETTSLQPSAVATLTDTQSFTNKTLDDATNDVTANALWNQAGDRVNINNAASALDQVLSITSLSPLQAEWGGGPVDITGLTAETTNDDADLLVVYDDTAGANRKMTRANFFKRRWRAP